MSRAAVQLKVAGQTYKVVTSAEEGELQRLADAVEDRMYAVTGPGRKPTQQALVLAAITLAHELEEERELRRRAEERYRTMLESLIGRIDAVLEETPLPVEAAARRTSASEAEALSEAPDPS